MNRQNGHHERKNNMKITTMLAMLALGVSALAVNAQNAAGPPPADQRPSGQTGPAGGPGGLELNGQRPPPSPLLRALDVNHDGVIDANEIANASAALLTLDKNGDGKLTPEELRPQRPARADISAGGAANLPARQAGPAGSPGGLGLDGQRPPPSRLMMALDANHDGVIDANEIANASAALLTLDKNGDGKLTPDELRPPRRSGAARGPAGPGRNGPPPDALLRALDKDGNGVIDESEIADAPASLLTLDKNGDGKLTQDELRPLGPAKGDGPDVPDVQGLPPSRLMMALDTNHDGVIDANEIANAPAALKMLDQNGDGELSQDELRPARPLKDGGPPPAAQ
jgi:Ca2+-binding EF-hand superfamily protein